MKLHYHLLYKNLPRSGKVATWLSIGLALPLASAVTASANVALSSLFSDGVVLQRGMPVPVWGKADEGEVVTVKIAGQEVKTTADASGHWTLKLPALKAGSPFEMVVTGKNTLTVHNVAVGEVWIASGQSNMEYRLGGVQAFLPSDSEYARQAKADTAAANDPLLRMFNVGKVTASEPVGNNPGPKGTWEAATPQSAAKFSAVAYHFARNLREKLNVPVGIIHSSWSSTPARAWTSREALDTDPEFKAIAEASEKQLKDLPAIQKHFLEVTIPAWKKEVEKAEAEGVTPPKKPIMPLRPQCEPAQSFNGMISPLIPFGIKGFIWYQGESDVAHAEQYRRLFPMMIKDWRARWDEGDIPFLFVQLANITRKQNGPFQSDWATQREAQTMALSLPNTGMALAIDLADADSPSNIHPHNKKEVGRRLSLVALATVYGQKVASYSGPIYSGVKISGNEARVSFTHVDGGLVAKGEKLQGFAIAGKDGRFVWGDAKIDGDAVVVSSAQVSEPVAVRYSWANNPIGNLVNKEGLPASPFRTDPDSAQ